MSRPATAAVTLLTGEREPVRLATTANISLSGLQTIDGVLTEVGDRVLVKNQTDATKNGIYTASTGPWDRAADARTARTMQKGTTVHVQQGAANAGNVYSFQTFDPIIGTSNIVLALYLSDDIVGDVTAAVASGVLTVQAAGAAEITELIAAGAPIVAAAENARDAALGAVPNVFATTRAALKALNTSTITSAFLKESGREGQFVWRTGDYASLIAVDTQEAIYIKADAIAAINGAWVRHGGWAVGGLDVRWFGVSFGATATRAAAIANSDAWRAALAMGLPIAGWNGEIQLALDIQVTLEGGATWAAFVVPTGTVIHGIWGKSVLKIRDGESTISNPIYWNMGAINGLVENLDISGVTFDLNGANNRISPTKTTVFYASNALVECVNHGASVGQIVKFTTTGILPPELTAGQGYYVKTVNDAHTVTVSATSGGAAIVMSTAGTGTHTIKLYNNFNCAAIFASGRIATSGADSRIVNGKVRNCIIKHSPGVTALAFGQQEGDGNKSYNVEVSGNLFANNGLDAADHSSLYMWGDNISAHHNVFHSDTLSTGLDGPVVAAELHGSNNSFEDNDIFNYGQIAWICGQWVKPTEMCSVSRNRAVVSWMGIGLWSLGGLDAGLRRVSINDNQIYVAAGTILHPSLGSCKIGLYLYNVAGVIQDITAKGNQVTTNDTTSNLGCVIACAAGGAVMSDVDVLNNQFRGFSRNIALGADNLGPVYNVTIDGNKMSDITPSSALASTRALRVTGNHGRITITNNKAGGGLNPTAAHPSIGFDISGTIEHLEMHGNQAPDATVEVQDVATVYGRRVGTPIPATLSGAWVSYGAPYAPLTYERDANGLVHITGHVKSGAAGSTIFTLPAGFRPAAVEVGVFVSVVSGLVGFVTVASGGTVTHQPGGAVDSVPLNMTFKAAA